MRRRLAVLIAPLLLVTPACGLFDDGDANALVPPPKVDATIVPEGIANGELKFYEYASAKKDFARAGDKSLVADGKLWELRRSDRLIGTLQISTLKNKVDLSDEKDRNAIVNQVMPGVSTKVTIDEIEVWTAVTPDKTSFLWFGDRMFELLQIKVSEGTEIADAEPLVEELVKFQKPKGVLEQPETEKDDEEVEDPDAE